MSLDSRANNDWLTGSVSRSMSLRSNGTVNGWVNSNSGYIAVRARSKFVVSISSPDRTPSDNSRWGSSSVVPSDHLPTPMQCSRLAGRSGESREITSPTSAITDADTNAIEIRLLEVLRRKPPCRRTMPTALLLNRVPVVHGHPLLFLSTVRK